MPFNLQDILGMDLDEMFGEALKELESSRSIWEQYIDPAMVDSALSKMTDPQVGESFEALFQHIENYLNQEDGIGSMFDQLLQNFNMPLNMMPFGNPVNPDELEEGEWQIIPNVPNPPAQPKQQQNPQNGTQKKGVSVI
ncbi:MAG: hypothetical protein GY751_07505 [Bacteroidetes bacterium]|nr:hypothetical protein [Bacteroidota bacterium]